MLTAREYHMREPLPLSRVQEAILDFCRGRQDVVVFGAQAVNLYVSEPRMTQDVDLLSPRPAEVVRELGEALHTALGMAVRSREVKAGKAYRLYQLKRQGNRHLADVRLAEFALDDAAEHDGVRYLSVPVLVAMKVRALARRRHSPKGGTDLADLRRLLLAYPELRAGTGAVAAAIDRVGGGAQAHATWGDLLRQPLVSDEESDEGY